MAENVLITPGTGDTIGADEISSVKYQRIKIIHGADGVNAGDVATGNPLPVVQTGTPALPTGASTAALQTQPGVDIGDVTINNSTGASAVNIQDGGNSITVDGAVTTTTTDVAPATQNVTVIDSSSSTATGANGQSVIIGTPTAGSAASFALSSIETIRVMVTGIWTGTLAAEQSLDGGTTWTGIGIHQGAYTTGSFTAGFVGGANIAGATNFRMRATAAITGTAVVKVIESINTQSVYIANAAPSGTVISILNSSTATLTSGSVYTGTGEDVTNFSEMRVSVFSDVASATDGLSLQQSSNGTNWDITDTYTVSLSAAGGGKTYVVPRQARFFRVVYTNGGTNQATFRIQTILNRTATAPSSQRATDAYTNETDLVQGQSFLMGYNGTTWDRIRTVGTGIVSTSAVLTAGSAIIGKVGIDQTTPGTTNLVALAANQSVNVAQINGVTPLMGNGTTGTGSQRVTIASDNTAFSVNATLSAETTKVIGVVRNSDGAGNLWTSNSTTPSAKFSQDTNVTSILGTAPTTVGKLDVKGADGDVFVRQATASNLNATVVGTGTFATQTTIAAGATSIAKAEDVASADADVGVPSLAVRKATPANTSGTDGDYEFLQISAGRLWASATIDAALPAGANAIGKLAANSGVTIGAVEIAAAQTLATVTTVSTVTAMGVGTTGPMKAEDVAHASGDMGFPAWSVRNDNLATTYAADQDYQPFATDKNGRTMVVQKAATATLTNVASSATSVTILAANASRVGAQVYNDSTQVLYLKFGATASATSFTVPLATNTYYEVPAGYTGILDGIWVSANGNARVTEET